MNCVPLDPPKKITEFTYADYETAKLVHRTMNEVAFNGITVSEEDVFTTRLAIYRHKISKSVFLSMGQCGLNFQNCFKALLQDTEIMCGF